MKVTINGIEKEFEKGTTMLDAAKACGVEIPTLCHIEGLDPSGACRMCVVEMEDNGRLVPSCSMEACDGMKFKTHSPKVLKARKTIVELLLSEHPDDCLYCERSNNCELQSLAENLNVKDRSFRKKSKKTNIDISSAAISRDPDKCILCGRCVRVCEEKQAVSAIDFTGRGSTTVVAPAFREGLNASTCINCGQCIIACPTGALTERNEIDEVLEAIQDPNKTVVVQHAPSVSVTIGEYFGVEAGKDVDGIFTAGLRQAGFDYVFDTSFSADLTIMEEANELIHRVKNGGKLPMFTSCSPGWIKFVEEFHPELLENISTCKSPQQMLGSMIKNYFFKEVRKEEKEIVSVSIMPCTAKKFEAGRNGMDIEGERDVDFVLTTREMAKLFKVMNIDITKLEAATPDHPFGERSGAGKIFGSTGGVMEAALRTAHFAITGREAEKLEFEQVRNKEGLRELSLDLDGLTVNVAVVSGLGNAKELLEDVKAGKSKYHFVEVMTCAGGCIAGGGQPLNVDIDKIKARRKELYNVDSNAKIRCSHHNEDVQKLYKDFLGEPLGHKSHKLLHTTYVNRKAMR